MRDLFLKNLTEQCHVSKGCGIVVGCSGGADSTALLALLHEVRDSLQLDLQVAHFDHSLRPESQDEAKFVAEMADSLGLPFHLRCMDVAELTSQAGENLEAGARRLRREFFEQLALETDASLIALGHHRDDQVETVLFRLLRGSGTAGLSGMGSYTPPYIRPLLEFGRMQLREFLQLRKIKWCEDGSNMELNRTRNRLRHQVLPLLNEIQSDAASKLLDHASRSAVDEAFWMQEVSNWMGQHARLQDGEMLLPLAGLTTVHPALRARLWLSALRQVSPESADEVTRAHLQACEGLLSGRAQAGIDLPGLWVGRRYQQIRVRRQTPAIADDWSIEVSGPGKYQLPDGARVDVVLTDRPGEKGPLVAEFHAAALSFPLQVRNRRAGDLFHPEGAPGSRKLKKFMIDARISLEDRGNLPLVVAERVLWVVGVRRCEGLRPEPGEKVVRVEFFNPAK